MKLQLTVLFVTLASISFLRKTSDTYKIDKRIWTLIYPLSNDSQCFFHLYHHSLPSSCVLLFSNWGEIHTAQNWLFLSEQFSGNEYTHIMQPPPLSSSKTFSLPQKSNLYPRRSCSHSPLLMGPRNYFWVLSSWSYWFWIRHKNASYNMWPFMPGFFHCARFQGSSMSQHASALHIIA